MAMNATPGINANGYGICTGDVTEKPVSDSQDILTRTDSMNSQDLTEIFKSNSFDAEMPDADHSEDSDSETASLSGRVSPIPIDGRSTPMPDMQEILTQDSNSGRASPSLQDSISSEEDADETNAMPKPEVATPVREVKVVDQPVKNVARKNLESWKAQSQRGLSGQIISRVKKGLSHLSAESIAQQVWIEKQNEITLLLDLAHKNKLKVYHVMNQLQKIVVKNLKEKKYSKDEAKTQRKAADIVACLVAKTQRDEVYYHLLQACALRFGKRPALAHEVFGSTFSVFIHEKLKSALDNFDSVKAMVGSFKEKLSECGYSAPDQSNLTEAADILVQFISDEMNNPSLKVVSREFYKSILLHLKPLSGCSFKELREFLKNELKFPNEEILDKHIKQLIKEQKVSRTILQHRFEEGIMKYYQNFGVVADDTNQDSIEARVELDAYAKALYTPKKDANGEKLWESPEHLIMLHTDILDKIDDIEKQLKLFPQDNQLLLSFLEIRVEFLNSHQRLQKFKFRPSDIIDKFSTLIYLNAFSEWDEPSTVTKRFETLFLLRKMNIVIDSLKSLNLDAKVAELRKNLSRISDENLITRSAARFLNQLRRIQQVYDIPLQYYKNKNVNLFEKECLELSFLPHISQKIIAHREAFIEELKELKKLCEQDEVAPLENFLSKLIINKKKHIDSLKTQKDNDVLLKFAALDLEFIQHSELTITRGNIKDIVIRKIKDIQEEVSALKLYLPLEPEAEYFKKEKDGLLKEAKIWELLNRNIFEQIEAKIKKQYGEKVTFEQQRQFEPIVWMLQEKLEVELKAALEDFIKIPS